LLFSLLVKTRGKQICVNMTKVETSGMKGRILRAADRHPCYRGRYDRGRDRHQ